MKRKNLWKRLSYITFSGMLAAAQPAAAGADVVFAQESDAAYAAEGAGEENGNVSEEPQTQTPSTESLQTEPPVTEHPQTEPPVTEHPQTEPPVTEPGTEPPSTEWQPPVTEPETEPQTQDAGPAQTEPESGGETEPGTAATEPDKAQTETSDEYIVGGETETGVAYIPTNLNGVEDHSPANANWRINVIASSAAYLGQLSNLYGLSFADDFAGVCGQVEKEFAETLADPQNFRASNWRDVIAVFLYEHKRQTGSGSITGASASLLAQIFREMNGAVQETEPVLEEPDMTQIFVDEYPIAEDMEQIDRQEELLLEGNSQLGTMGILAEEYIADMADAQREAKREEQKLQMDKERYDKWLRRKQQKEQQPQQKKQELPAAASLTPMTIDDYVQKHGIDADGREAIQRYASAECLQLCAIASAEPQIVRASVGNDISDERVRIVTAAYSLVGKVGYFWGGKSYAFGWDSRWGTLATVTAKGSTSTGTTRKYGLDCSGFTLYCYYNGLRGSDAGIGGHTTTQWNASAMVDQVSAQPGDLVFYGGPERGDLNHVGLVVGKSSDGGLIVAHCSSSVNGVVVGEAWSSGFRYVRHVAALP